MPPRHPLRVAVLASAFPTLSETFVLDQITGLMARGATVDVFAWDGSRHGPVHADVERFGLRERTLHPAEPAGPLWRRRLHLVRLTARALAPAMRDGANPATAVAAALADARSAFWWNPPGFPRRPRSYDAIHCHFGPVGRVGLALRNTGFLSGRLYTTFHGFDMSSHLRQVGESAYARLFRSGDAFLPISDFWRRRLIALGAPAERTVVHHMGVDCAGLPFAPRRAPDGGPVRLLSVARLVEKKGLEYAIRAVAAATALGQHLEYRIVGDGPLHGELRALIDGLGVSGVVSLEGPLAREDVRREMDAAHIFVAPSVTAANGDMEGIPVAIMEAMALGLPVVSTRHSGIPELVRHGHSGLLVEERDAEGLTRALMELVADPESWLRLGSAARESVERDFSIERLDDRLLALLRDGVGAQCGRCVIPPEGRSTRSTTTV